LDDELLQEWVVQNGSGFTFGLELYKLKQLLSGPHDFDIKVMRMNGRLLSCLSI
jgi:hypothetical protein